ncbi:MAG: 4Fe-4S binding protein [Firmicutes bacterium]|nr:4Fe-4S binding protein [Bacillota bacterium]
MSSPGRPLSVAARRLRTQAASTVVANAGLVPGLRCLTYPFLNCYSCPLAIGACPVGTVQHFVILGRLPLLALGLLGAVGSIWGRMTCAWLCPFGLLQDLLHRIPWPRRKLNVRTRRYTWVKYAVLVALVVVLPLATLEPWFCKLCPAGLVGAGLPWLATSPPLRGLVGSFFWFKAALAAAVLLACVFVSRPFCRFLCPLGAAYGLFNRVSRVRLEADPSLCTRCGRCEEACPMGLEPWRDAGSTDCIRCEQCLGCRALRLDSPPLFPAGPRRPRREILKGAER